MTSSLVGSEMCIRDSLSSGNTCQACYALKEAFCGIGLIMILVRHNVFTVSYTHLTLPTICSV
eukprot:12554835-Prorocentrum_lima.AAC.1